MKGTIVADPAAPLPPVRCGRAAIGIPTYRRPAKLERLLTSLEPSITQQGATVLVGDNGCDAATRAVVDRFVGDGLPVRYLPVAERGISANRNAILDAFLALEAQPGWLGMLDDDLVAPPDWLARMVSTGEAVGADIVGSAYGMTQPAGPFLVRESVFVKRRRRPTGPTAPFHAAGNVLIARGFLADHPTLRFDNRFGLSGGEDYDLFSRAADAGARFAWCDEAFCEEDVDVARLNARAVLYRYYTTGNYMALIDLARESRSSAWRRHTVALAKAGAYAAMGGARGRPADMVEGLFRALIASGALSALLGARHQRYR